MEKFYVLGTGSGTPKKCYSLSGILENNGNYLLVDTGGGLQILSRIQQAGIEINKIHDLFISHKHIDHLLGVFPFIRSITQLMGRNKYDGILNVYCDEEVKQIIDTFIRATFHQTHIDLFHARVIFHNITNNDVYNIIGYKLKVINLYSIECLQYGFEVTLNNSKRLYFLGDVPLSEKNYKLIENADYVLHEAFCLDREKDIYNPHRINHSTVVDVCKVMEKLNVKNLILWHTKDSDIENRKKLFTEEGKEFFKGNIFVPNDLEIIELQ